MFNFDIYHTNNVMFIWQLSNFTTTPPPSRALFQAQAGTRVEPTTFCNLAGLLPDMIESKVSGGIQNHINEGQAIITH